MINLNGSMVSSEQRFLENDPQHKSSFERINFELRYIKQRERVTTLGAAACTALAIITLFGLIPGGQVVFGALMAIALLAFLYAFLCRQAEMSLRERQITQISQGG